MKKLFIVAALLAVVALWVWWFSPTQVLTRRTEKLMEILTIEKGTGAASRQAKVFSLNSMLADQIELSAEEPPEANGLFGKDEIESAFSWICGHAIDSKFEVEIIDRVEAGGGQGEVKGRMRGLMNLPGYRPADGIYDFSITWQEGEDGWRFSKVRVMNR